MATVPIAAAPSAAVERILSRPSYILYDEEKFVPLEEYLTSSYDPDMDYVDGHLEVRNLGEYEHGELQGALFAVFYRHAKEWGIRVVPECRLQVKEDRFRIPDLMVLRRAENKPDRIVRSAPLLCIEVLSPRDTFTRIQTRMADYVAMGVPNVWLFDPKDLRRVLVYGEGKQAWLQDRVLTIAGSAIHIDLGEIAQKIAED